MTETPTRAAKWYWGLCAFVGGVLTLTVNVAHGMGIVPASHTVPAGMVAAVPPAMTIALFEGYFIAKRCVPKHVLRMVLTAVVVLGGAAFSISYTSIAMFLNRQPGDLPEWTGWVIPALLDIFVIVSAYVLYVLSKHAETAVEVPKSSRWRRLADAATNRMEAALTVPVEPQVETFVEARGGFAEPPVDSSTKAAEPATEASMEPPEPFVEEPTKPSVKPTVEVKKTSTKPSTNSELEPFMDAAKRMVAKGVVARKSAVELAQVIAAIDNGMTDNAIKSAGIASASTAAKVRVAWQQPADEPDRQLLAV